MQQTLVEHHTHYKELHGYDKTVWMEKGEHFALHHRLRKEGKCNIPIKMLAKISNAANNRSEKQKLWRKTHTIQNIGVLRFSESLAPNVRHNEQIKYNYITGLVSCCCYFEGTHRHELLEVEIT